MNKDIFKHPQFYIAIGALCLSLFFLFRGGNFAYTAAFIWFISSILNFYKAIKKIKALQKIH